MVASTSYEPNHQPSAVVERLKPAVLPPATAARLQAIEGDEEPTPTDEEQAADFAFILVGSQLQADYLAWARAETSAMVAADSSVIERLADELLTHTAMSSRQVRAVVRGDRKA